MRLKLTLVLFLANVAVFFVLWRLDRQVEPSIVPSGPLSSDMTDLDRVQISGRLLTDGDRVLVRDRAGNWQITAPVVWPANNFAVQNLVNQLQFLEQEASFPADQLSTSGQTLADYGLADPGLVLTLGAGNHTEKLLVGAPTQLGARLYVMNPDDHLIRVVPQELLKDLALPLADLRNERIFSLPYFEITGLSVRGAPASDGSEPGAVAPPAGGQGLGAPKVTLLKADDQWRMDTPVQCPADTLLVNGIVAQLDALTVTDFLAPAQQDAARQGLTNPSMRVTLTGGTSQTLLLGQRVPPAPDAPNAPAQYYAQLEPVPGEPANATTVFTVAAGPFEILQNAQESLRERKFLDFDPAAVSALEVQFGNTSVRIQKSESGDWQILPALDPADAALLQELLDNLQKLEAVNFASDAPSQDDLHSFGLDDPQRVVTLQIKGTPQPLTFSLGINQNVSPMRYYIQVAGSPFVYEIGPAVLGWLRTDPLYYRDRTLESLPAAAQVESLQLTDLASNQTVFDFALDAQNTTWDALLAKQPAPVHDGVLALEKAVGNFTVASYLQANFTGNYSLDPQTPTPWRYRLDAGIRLPGAAQGSAASPLWVCYFTERLGGLMQIGGTPQPPMIFTLPQSLIDALYGLTLAVTPPPPVEKGLQELNQPIDARNPPAPAPAAGNTTTTR
ncbi:MAG: DUF4340 domain-containing protein [Opitutales bacterium]|jgi:hypothetical protein